MRPHTFSVRREPATRLRSYAENSTTDSPLDPVAGGLARARPNSQLAERGPALSCQRKLVAAAGGLSRTTMIPLPYAQALSVKRPRWSFNQFAQDRHQEPKFTRCGPACRGRSGCILDHLNQTPHALDKSLANHSVIQIVQYHVQKPTFRACATDGL
jgi:hypothetical protein